MAPKQNEGLRSLSSVLPFVSTLISPLGVHVSPPLDPDAHECQLHMPGLQWNNRDTGFIFNGTLLRQLGICTQDMVTNLKLRQPRKL